MKKNINYVLLFVMAASIMIGACKKTDYKFGQIVTPTDVAVAAAIQGAPGSPTGDGSGNIKVTVTATHALAYKIYWGDGDSLVTALDTASHQYHKLDTNTYTITVNAVGTGGATSTVNKQVTVAYLFQLPADVLADLTNGTSKTWQVASDTAGNFGVGPSSTFTPDYYSAGPNQEPACAYDDVVTFTKAGPNSVSINDNNQGSSFLIAASTAFYGQSGPDGCYVVNTGGTKPLGFSGATSASTTANSTRIQFSVPGTGLVSFGTGAVTYEILSISPTVISLRNIGIDGNAWYQILRATK